MASSRSNMRVCKQIIAFIFLVLFFIFSLSSFNVYYNGDIVYNVFFDYENEIIHFPSVTLCPSLEINNLVNLKLNEIQKDFNMSFKSLESFMIYRNLKTTKQLTSMIEKYSFSLKYFDTFFAHLFFQMNRWSMNLVDL